MYTLITIFYVSFVGIILMVLLKRGETRTGRPSLVSRIGRGSDQFFHTVFSAVSVMFSYINKHTFVALAHWMAFHVLLRIRTIYVELKARFIEHPQGKKMLDAVRGRGEVTDHGASFYLRRISGK